MKSDFLLCYISSPFNYKIFKKMKKYIIYIVLIAVGLVIGKFVFSNSTVNTKTTDTAKSIVVKNWTCSMHPEINLPEPGDCPKCGMDLIPATTGDEGLDVNQFKMTENAMALANVQTLFVGKKNVIKKIPSGNLRLSGKIQENGNTSAMQTAHFGGRVERLYFKTEGESVNRGALIATVYSPELVTAQNELLEAMKIKKLQPELYNAVRNKLKNWKVSENQIQKIERTKKVIINFNMYANVSGVITKMLTKEGNHVKEGTPLFMISNLNSVWAVFDVYEQDIINLKKGQQLTIVPNAYPNEKIEAKINFINPILNSKTRTIAIRATLKNNKNKLKPGMLVSSFVNVSNNNETSTIVKIPKTAVLWTGKRSVIYVKPNKNESIFELREVELGQSLGDKYQIISGLKNGEEIVVNGAFTVDAVAQLQGKLSMMNKKDNEEESKEKEIKRIEVSAKFKEQLNVVLKNYFKLKDAFVLTDVKKASEQAKYTLESLKKVKINLLKKPEAHEVWVPAEKIIKITLQDILKETDIEKQRLAFVNLSDAMITAISSFGTGTNKVYVKNCPMVNNNKGADWLSLEEKIKNPYFGDKMLKCGIVKRDIK